MDKLDELLDKLDRKKMAISKAKTLREMRELLREIDDLSVEVMKECAKRVKDSEGDNEEFYQTTICI